MKAKEYLQQLKRLDTLINQKMQEIRRITQYVNSRFY